MAYSIVVNDTHGMINENGNEIARFTFSPLEGWTLELNPAPHFDPELAVEIEHATNCKYGGIVDLIAVALPILGLD